MIRRLVLAFLFVLLALLCAGFVRMNRTATQVDLYFAAVPASVGEALVVACVVGWALGVAGAIGWALRLERERAALRRALKLAEGEVRTLRAAAPAHAR